jgi:hypothetical protein
MAEILENESVKKVRDALAAAGLSDRVVELTETARSAEDAPRPSASSSAPSSRP